MLLPLALELVTLQLRRVVLPLIVLFPINGFILSVVDSRGRVP